MFSAAITDTSLWFERMSNERDSAVPLVRNRTISDKDSSGEVRQNRLPMFFEWILTFLLIECHSNIRN